MTKRLLIDASHAEETRVVVLDGNRLEDFDVETLSRRQLKGNIYLAKVVRVEPSLQAAFVEYGGNRHGFLAFGEIHPDYYQIPVADRQRLIALQEEEARAEEEADEAASETSTSSIYSGASGEDEPAAAQPLAIVPEAIRSDSGQPGARQDDPEDAAEHRDAAAGSLELGADSAPEVAEPAPMSESWPDSQAGSTFEPDPTKEPGAAADLGSMSGPGSSEPASAQDVGDYPPHTAEHAGEQSELPSSRIRQISGDDAPAPETVGGETDVAEETRAPRQQSRFTRSYKIQEVIRRRQILLVQVVKEERGTKGAALTTYISLAGRYCVLMPNSPRGGGISRKITSTADRRRLKEVTAELDIPRGMGLIVRTAGAARPKPEIKRDGEYLLQLWDDIREQTMRSIAPALIHEEASLIKRAIRDVYSRDVDELLVDGEDGWRAARDYMRMLMPTHVKKVQLWPSNAQPLFAHSQVEAMLDAMLSPTVQLRSGGYLVINQTEALVAIDVNSGRSTRERGIEETALRTNLEAAEEAARQLRLRDLAGLIVIDFIDMESKKHNAMVERRIADALKTDRARIQLGHISHFGLLELSRQRLRPSLAETSLNVCAVCGGSGHVRSTESAALHVLREIEEEGGKRRAAEILVHVATDTAVYILNNKRQRLTEIEARYGMRVCFAPDDTLLASQTRIDRTRAATPQDLPAIPSPQAQAMPDDDAGEADIADDEGDVEMPQTRVEAGASAAIAPSDDFTSDADHVPGETAAEGEQRRRRRRRRRRGGRREDGLAAETTLPVLDGAEQPDIPDLHAPSQGQPLPTSTDHSPLTHEAEEAEASPQDATAPPVAAEAVTAEITGEQARAKRGRRGGRRRRKPGDEAESAPPGDDAVVEPFTGYVGPTPADPFAMAGLDIFDALEQAEMRPTSRVVAEAPQPPAEMDNGPDGGATTELPSGDDAGQPTLQHDDKALAVETTQVEPPATELQASEADSATLDQAEHEAVPQPAPVAEPTSGKVIQPTLIGAVEPDSTERKRGWWRR